MDQISPWIASSVERCLSSYLGAATDSVTRVSDDGHSLRFTFGRALTPMLAIIAEWDLGAARDRATLMDSENQIEAILAREAFDECQRESIGTQPMNDSPRKHTIQLLDFEIVFVYSAPAPDVQLYVNSFRINWDGGTVKFTLSKKLKRNQAVRSLVHATYQKIHKIRPASKAPVSPSSPSTPSAKSTASRFDPCTQSGLDQISPLCGAESQQLFSQVPSIHHSRLAGNNHHAGRPSLNGSTDLLRLLGRTASVPKYDSIAPGEASSHDTRPVGAAEPPAANTSESSSLRSLDNASTSGLPKQANTNSDSLPSNEQSGVSRDQSIAETAVELVETGPLAAIETHEQLSNFRNAGEVQWEENREASKKRQRASPDLVYSEPRDDGQNIQAAKESNCGSPCRKRQRTGTAKEPQAGLAGTHRDDENNTRSSPGAQTTVGHLHDEIISEPEDPWAGLTNIPTRDVTIPKDQAELLDGNFCWIPPNTGDPMPQGHVPSSLLGQWNNIARRRQELAEQVQRTPEASQPTATQESPISTSDTNSETHKEYEWSVTPEPRHPQSRLPADSSPVRAQSWSRKKPTPSGDLNNSRLSQQVQDGGLELAIDSRSQSQPGLDNIVSLEVSTPQKSSQRKEPPEKASQNLEHSPRSSEVNPPHCGSRPSDANMKEPGKGLGDLSTNPATLDQSSSEDKVGVRAESPEADTRSASAETDDESDESEMDTSVPLALGGSPPAQLLSSQAEQDVTSSGPSLPGSSLEGHVQVKETPAINNIRLCLDHGDKKQLEAGPDDPKPPSSQADKTSSQTLIFNTYRTPENHRMRSSKAPRPPSRHSVGPLQVDVLGTQTQLSSLVSASQDATLPSQPSQSGIVVDSSGPISRHRDISMSGSEAPGEPSIPFLSSGGPIMSQQKQQSQDSWRGISSTEDPMNSPQISPLKRLSSEVLNQEWPPSRNPKRLLREAADLGQASSGSPDSKLVARRQSFIKNPEKSAEALRIYEKFCNDYPSYSGDFAHFTELCSRLQAVRDKGYLQRSFLWDDFVIMHLQEYARHIEDCASQESKLPTYEDYFSSNFSRPRHKKRSLTAHGIEVATTQFVPVVNVNEASDGSAQALPAASAGNETPSGTTSLVDRLSSFHARSFNEAGRLDHLRTGVHLSHPIMGTLILSATASSGETGIKQNSSIFDSGEPLKSQPYPASSCDSKPVQSSLDEDMHGSLDAPNTNANAAPTQDDKVMAEAEESEQDDDTHDDTASVELGDDDADDVVTAPASPRTEVVSDVGSEAESDNENWFLSLRHVCPSSPVWSDDPNTPFKIWARADQNVKSERRRRRGAKVLVDEKGVIQRVSAAR